MKYDLRFIASFPPRKCGIGTFTRDSSTSLQHFTGEINSIRVAAIDKNLGEKAYHVPVDIVIKQNDPNSWIRAAAHIQARAIERPRSETIAILQHEYGLDGDDWISGKNYVEISRRLHQADIPVITYTHTIFTNPEHENTVRTMQEIAEYSDMVIVPAKRAIDTLSNPNGPYKINPEKIRNVDHGIRMGEMQDRYEVKKAHNLEDIFVIETLGMKSQNKGIEFGIEGYGLFLRNSLHDSDRKRIVYIISGDYHPEFKKYEGGKSYREYEKKISESAEKYKLRIKRTPNLSSLSRRDFERHDIIMEEKFLDDAEIVARYAMSNAVLIPSRNYQQISSGILADTVGSGRVAIASAFEHALDLLVDNPEETNSVRGISDPWARGIVVSLDGEKKDIPNVEQIAQGLYHTVFNEQERILMEHRARARGIEMTWTRTSARVIQCIEEVLERKRTPKGRGPKFEKR